MRALESPVDVKSLEDGEPHAARLAHERTLAAVDPQVLVEVVLDLEGFLTVRAVQSSFGLSTFAADSVGFFGTEGFRVQGRRMLRSCCRRPPLPLAAPFDVLGVGAGLQDVVDLVVLEPIHVLELYATEATAAGVLLELRRTAIRWLVVDEVVPEEVGRGRELPIALWTRKHLQRGLDGVSVGIHPLVDAPGVRVDSSLLQEERPVHDTLVLKKSRPQHVLLAQSAPAHRAQQALGLLGVERVVLFHVLLDDILLRRREIARVAGEVAVGSLDVMRHPVAVEVGGLDARLVAALADESAGVCLQVLLVLKLSVRGVLASDADVHLRFLLHAIVLCEYFLRVRRTGRLSASPVFVGHRDFHFAEVVGGSVSF